MQEVDEFRREKYARDDEHTKAWPLTALGATGSAIAIVGVMLYSLAKAHDGQAAATKAAKAS